MKLCRITSTLIPLLLLALCAGCSLKKDGGSPVMAGDSMQAWELYSARARAADMNTGPFRVSGTIRYTMKDGDGARGSYLVWGNGSLEQPYPLRLDVLSGAGTVVAKVREEQSSFIAFVPEENTAYIHSGESIQTLARFIPIPMTLNDLTLLITGRSGAVFTGPAVYQGPGSSGFVYRTSSEKLPGYLEVSASGAPLSWQAFDRGWTIEFEPRTDNPLLIRRLRISHPEGYSAIVVVRDFDKLPSRFEESRLALTLPQGVVREQLED